MIATPAPTFAPGQPCLVRIVGHYEYRDFAHYGGEISYLDVFFKVERAHIVAIIDPRERLALIELHATILQPTGKASFLVGYQGHRLRVHVQQIHELEQEFKALATPELPREHIQRAMELVAEMRVSLNDREYHVKSLHHALLAYDHFQSDTPREE